MPMASALRPQTTTAPVVAYVATLAAVMPAVSYGPAPSTADPPEVCTK
jgi:hypothetical protein